MRHVKRLLLRPSERSGGKLEPVASQLHEKGVKLCRYDWPEKNLYGGDDKMDWKVLPFVHTFPGNDPTRTTWIDAHCKDCPVISSILRKIPGLRIALLSRLGPNTVLSAHQVSLQRQG